ncbi:MAG: hypothetical protein JWL81_699, partial [Verrucomicrobiales bacterium]|nr:hypothetical protein [Verrucomicrobiales bacterium]
MGLHPHRHPALAAPGSRVIVFQSYDDPSANTTCLAEFHVGISDSAPPPDSIPDTPQQAAELTVYEHLKPALLGSLTAPGTPGPPAPPGPKRLIRLRRTAISSQANGLPDWWYLSHGINPFQNYYSSYLDNDGDGFTNQQEFTAGTNPKSADSDLDGAPDGYENANGADPLNPETYPPIFRWVSRWGSAFTSVPHPLPDGSTTFYNVQNAWLYGEGIEPDAQTSWQGTPHFSTLAATLIGVPGLTELPPPNAGRSNAIPEQTGFAHVYRVADGSSGQAGQPLWRVWLEQKPAPAVDVVRLFLHAIDSVTYTYVEGIAEPAEHQVRAEPLIFSIPAGTGSSAAYSEAQDVAPKILNMDPPNGTRKEQFFTTRITTPQLQSVTFSGNGSREFFTVKADDGEDFTA